MQLRSILQFNIDSFPAVVEQKRKPELLGKPVIVAEEKGNTSGVVISASREARKAGVEEGLSVRIAQRMCPNAAVLRADYGVYRHVSDQFMEILAKYSPLLEPDSLGSAYLDVTACRNLFGDARRISAEVSTQVFEKLHLPLFIGCASNKLVAGIASHTGKRFNWIKPGLEAGFLAPLSIKMLSSVNAKNEKRLSELGVSTIGQLAQISERMLVRQFGAIGSLMAKQSRGEDASQVGAAYPPEIIIIEQTFGIPAEEPAELVEQLQEMANEAGLQLRRRGGLAGEITLKLYDESSGREDCLPAYFHFKKPTDSPAHMLQSLEKLLESKMRPGMEIFRAQVLLSELTLGESSQLCLMGDGEHKQRLNRAVELVRDRFGEGSICLAGTLVTTGRGRVLTRIAA